MTTLRELLNPDLGVVSIPADATVREAAKKMAEVNVGCVCILDEKGRLLGLFTERDILKRVLLKDLRTDATRVSEVMTRQIVTARPEQPHTDGMRLMREHHIRHLPVVEPDGTVLGVLSIRDLVREEARQARRTAEAVRNFIQDAEPFGG